MSTSEVNLPHMLVMSKHVYYLHLFKYPTFTKCVEFLNVFRPQHV